MKKADHIREVILNVKRERKRNKRKGKNYFDKDFRTDVASREERWKIDFDNKQIKKHDFELHRFLDKEGYQKDVKFGGSTILIPSDFRLEEKQGAVFKTIKEIRSTLMLKNGLELTLDFSKCQNVDFASLFVLRTILTEYLSSLKRLSGRLQILNVKSSVMIRKSEYESVNMELLACEMISSAKIKKASLLPSTSFVFHKGSKSQSKYSENRKGKVVTNMRNYIDNCLKSQEAGLTSTSKRDLDGIISEILNNAEDHSYFDTWYAFGNFFKSTEKEGEEMVGEINLAFMNFGFSIYDGIMETKNQSKNQFDQVTEIYNQVKRKDIFNKFTPENLYTLYSLQDGISRLKHVKRSRGTGTMKFIKSFQDIGDYECKEKGYVPRLLIFSGNTIVKCDNQYKPFKKGSRNFISLNNSESLGDLPEKTHLITSKQKFPGTLLIVKVYLNKQHLYNKIDNGRKDN